MVTQEDLARIQEARDKYVKDLWGQLYSLHQATVNKTHTYLFATNAGAAAGLLAYMGSKNSGPFPISFSIGLFFFFLGVLLVGWPHERSYQKFSRLIRLLNDNAKIFYTEPSDENWGRLIDQYGELSNKSYWIDGIGYGSWACFFLGSVSVLSSFLC